MTLEGRYDDDPLDLILPDTMEIEEMLHVTYLAWRMEQEARPISLRGALVPLLKKLPATWIAGIAQALGTKGHSKAQQIVEIGRVMADPFSLTHVVEKLPTIVRRVLKAVLNHMGQAERIGHHPANFDDLLGFTVAFGAKRLGNPRRSR